MHRTLAEVMTRNVITIGPDASLKEVARTLHDNDVSALPVVDTRHRPIGVISEADLLRRQAGLPDPQGRPGLRGPDGEGGHACEARTAGDLMSAPVLTARPGWSLVESARYMHDRGVKRLPVIDEVGTVVGIVSRSDLLLPLLRGDGAIRDEIVHEVLGQTLRMAPSGITVAVTDGVVRLSGRVEERSSIPLVERLCCSVDGVLSVEQSLDYAFDDLAT